MFYFFIILNEGILIILYTIEQKMANGGAIW